MSIPCFVPPIIRCIFNLVIFLKKSLFIFISLCFFSYVGGEASTYAVAYVWQ